ncbi:tetratricopeptide repeat protein [Streptomyces sp. Amel2xB2]|uniref:tetratricopeptide repeat protein n=1 Tax=Streptomyces sp. Amel2xB2 TaxID=1305829 RepID=UPI000DB9B2B6|nr:tetratricopeptide repeat protein [Streptomyces sp. Amel2xB2]RAJ58889.1 tetratricopeptide repeat protein [Streptomyces sp. Amel2xB2]
MSGTQDGRADGEGRVFQAAGDQHITEHHHHGETAASGWAGTESVRQPTGGQEAAVLRDRTELMETLRSAVRGDAAGQVFVLHGLGGCGKTAVARALFRFATDQGRIGLWVNAADRTSLRSGMLAVAADRGAGDGQLAAARNGMRAPADLVWDRLDASEQPWLLVLDNADAPEILQEGGWLRTSPRGTVLVTTRRSSVGFWPHAELHHVGVLPHDAAAQVLHDLAPDTGTVEEAAEIAERLGRLPLALILAGGFLSHQVIDPWTMTKYGQRLSGDGSLELIDQGAVAYPQGDARQLINKTWQLSLDALAGHGVPEAAELLRLLACYGPDPLPLAVLNSPRIESVLPRARSEAALRGLLDQSLTALVDPGVRCVQTHALLLTSVAGSAPPERFAQLTRTATRLLDELVPAVPERGPQDLRLRLAAPHVVALLRQTTDVPVVEEALDVAVRLACALHRTGDYLSAWELAADAAATTEPKLGADHRLVLSAHSRTGRALFRLGRFEESETVLRRVLAERERLFGPDDPDTLEACFAINHPLQQLGRESEGLALLRRSTDGRRRVLGEEHPLTLQSRAHMLEFVPTGELAAEIDEATMQLPEECALHLGGDHAVTLASLLSHSFALVRLDRLEAADEEARRTAEEYESRFDPDYALTLSAKLLYARVRAGLGDPASAVELMDQVAHRREQSLGAEHPYTVRSYALLDEYRAQAGGTAAG